MTSRPKENLANLENLVLWCWSFVAPRALPSFVWVSRINRLLAEQGHSRVPLFLGSKNRVVGMLLTKSLLMADPNTESTISENNIRPMPIVTDSKSLYEMLKLFQTGRSHMAIVVDKTDHTTLRGIVTMEDVIEELLGEEIYDETDPEGRLFDPDIPQQIDITRRSILLRASLQQHYPVSPTNNKDARGGFSQPSSPHGGATGRHQQRSSSKGRSAERGTGERTPLLKVDTQQP